MAWRGRPKPKFHKLIARADAANAARDWHQAEIEYESALKLQPALPAIWVQYGHALKEQGRLEPAERAYRRALALDGSVADTHLQLGHVAKLQGRPAQAQASYRQAYQLDPSDDARRELDYIAQSAPSPPATTRPDAWKERFQVSEFRALNPELARGVRTRAEAYAAFLRDGVGQLAPIANDTVFDPDFYRERYPDTRDYDPVDAYRHWLFTGAAEGRLVSEADVYQRVLIGRTAFPKNFDWKTYVKGLCPKPDGRPHTQLDAVEHLLEYGFATGAALPTHDGKPGSILEHIADYCWGRGDQETAINALQKAIAADPTAGRLQHRLGDYYLAQNDPERAHACFDQALSLGYRSIWTYLHLVDHATQVEDFDRAYGYLAVSRETFAGEAIWRRKLDQVVNADFERGTATGQALLKSPTPDAADAQLSAVLQRIVTAFTELDDLPARIPPAPQGHVVMFCLQLVPQCRHYRVEQRCEQLDALGVEYRLFAGDEAAQAREALIGARALLVYREPAYPETIRLILHAKALGIPTLYEIDDLIFDAAHYPDPFSFYKGQISYEGYVGLLQGRTLYRFAMVLCDAGIGSTKALCRHIAAAIPSGICHHVPNGLDSRNRVFLDTPPPDATERTFIFYGSGTRAHNRNFNQSAGPALVDVLAARPATRLVIVGYLDLDPIFDAVQDQVIRLDFSADVHAYWALLSEVDINLALLVPGEMNDCKSEIKWLEAAAAGIPSIVSPSATYRDELTDGVNVLMAASIGAMRDALFRLVDDPAFRRQIGAAARAHAMHAFSLDATAARVGAMLDGLHPPAALQTPSPQTPARRRTRLLVVNVFFPPQTFGGATRVVRDNVDALLLHYSDEFELAVFTTDTGGPPDSARVGHYNAIPVFRVWPVLGENPERDFDREDVADRFATVLDAWAPDIVHFHCIQYLTGSLLATCQAQDIPYIVTVHDGWWISQFQFFLDEDDFFCLPAARALLDDQAQGALLPVMRRRHFLARQLDGAAAVLAVSESFAEIYRKAGIRRVTAIPNGLSSIFAAAPPLRAPHGGRVRIGHIAGWAFHKGIHLFQAALLRGAFTNLEAVVIDHTREETYRLQVTWGTTPVTILGKVRQEAVLDLYNRIDVLVAPSIWPESYGLVSREAQRCGLWVVASDLGAIAEDIVEGENGFVVDVSDAEDIRRALEQIESDPARYQTSPARPPVLRLADAQVDDLVQLYRTVSPSGPETR